MVHSWTERQIVTAVAMHVVLRNLSTGGMYKAIDQAVVQNE